MDEVRTRRLVMAWKVKEFQMFWLLVWLFGGSWDVGWIWLNAGFILPTNALWVDYAHNECFGDIKLQRFCFVRSARQKEGTAQWRLGKFGWNLEKLAADKWNLKDGFWMMQQGPFFVVPKTWWNMGMKNPVFGDTSRYISMVSMSYVSFLVAFCEPI